MQKHGYIGEFEIVDDHRSGKIVIELTGRIKCGVIRPASTPSSRTWSRGSTTSSLAPVRPPVLSTTFGIMDHEEARRKRTGGKILGFFYRRPAAEASRARRRGTSDARRDAHL
ncbi:hypothetical protein JL721_11899 [Aureococcus anophagefferens]|nr:hypothetical protein JL721_11899 [Aureococcus anophagefferens]